MKLFIYLKQTDPKLASFNFEDAQLYHLNGMFQTKLVNINFKWNTHRKPLLDSGEKHCNDTKNILKSKN